MIPKEYECVYIILLLIIMLQKVVWGLQGPKYFDAINGAYKYEYSK
jgi:hypothetical protein